MAGAIDRYMGPARSTGANNLQMALRRCRAAFLGVAVLSGVINVLALTGSLYMLQVYDRVIPSKSVPTLMALSLLLVGLYACYGVIDLIRSRIMARVGLQLDRRLRDPVYSAVVRLPLLSRSRGNGLQPVHDLDSVRLFLAGPGPTALFDMPWLPVFLVIVWLLHPLLGALALGGALLLLGLAIATEAMSRAPARASAESGALRTRFGEASRRNSEVIKAMGMERRTCEVWAAYNSQFLNDQAAAANVTGNFGAITKVARLVLQSAVLGLGAWLVIRGEATGGVMIAASIITARALAPIEIAIAHWRGFITARQSLVRLRHLLTALDRTEPETQLPRPQKGIAVQGLWVAAPGSPTPIVQNVSFTLEAGAGLALIGPSGSGKSTLARALVGVWPAMPQRGSVRLDGAPLDQYDSEALGRDIGYLSQELELIDGTVAENISRFDATATSEQVVAAAKLASVHEMILNLPQGYDTQIGEAGSALSGGQRQRVALARALYGDPFLVVLDEPNSNLDLPGDLALSEGIKAVRRRGGIIIVVAHRPTALAGLDQVMVLNGGQIQAFGPKDEVLKKVAPPTGSPGPTSQPTPAPVVRPLPLRVVPDTDTAG
ncbi:MAG: type I secretion system permease/ATPase [Hyphomicrobiaceae bacterium]